jgi:hypothetical protein
VLFLATKIRISVDLFELQWAQGKIENVEGVLIFKPQRHGRIEPQEAQSRQGNASVKK